ncbi:hypothetical protein EDB81DRAFT_189166 [Dactylonectria macrodidyma]|uniref:F-box domain-containing protein n=1 Tax=Dactylonectria macrodidyma TaxID=307937 RepID=A0A9P9FQS3_9HYPO|nr:hypothetical protein EDB81DRAFT_189166 [Dactylonectria macrodidyma]
MFEVDHDHHGSDFKRFFSPGRSSMTAVDDKRAEAFRRHVWAVTMIDEDPLSGKGSRHVADITRPGPNKLRSKRRASAYGALSPVAVLPSEPTTPQLEEIPSKAETNTAESTMKGPMVTVQPMHPSPFGPATDLYPVREDLYPVREDSADSTIALQRGACSSFPHYSIYPGLGTPAADPTKATDSLPVVKLNRPRKLSHGSTASVPSMHFGDNLGMGTGLGPRSSIGAGRRSASWGSKANFEAAGSVAQWRPEYLYQRPMAANRRQAPTRASLQQNEMFAMLPGEVLSLIMDKLRDLHLRPGSESCATCWMRDVCNVSLASRKWHKTARIALYDDIQLVGADLTAHKKKYKLNQGARVRMLRRSLRANPQLARLVRVLKVPAPESPAKGSSVAEYDDLIASLVMACPNLESLSGPTTGYDHSFKKIFHALSTRHNLKHMSWLVHAPPHQKHQRMHSRSQQQLGLVMPAELLRFQETTFLNHHHHWARLETLTIHCVPGASLAPETLLTKTLECLRSLKHLHLCNVSPSGFNDANLLALPPLQTLTLSAITGITSNGLSAFATRSNSLSLRKLHLRHTPLTSLAALARILSNLRSLVSFALIQASSPLMPDEDSFTLWMMPYLASSSIKKLHWDITAHATSVNAADDILSRSITAGGFPALRSLRVPNDPDGLFQDLCYPVERIDLHMDRFRTPDPPAEMVGLGVDSSPTNTSPISPTRYLFKSSSNTSLQSGPPAGGVRHPVATNLHAARLAAQARLEAAHSRPRFTVNVIEEDGTTAETFCMAGFIGTPGSEIKYHLLPDVGSTDEKGGLVAVRDLECDGGESLAGGREGCLGRWNTRDGFMADRKEKEKWWHTERGRWTKLTL